MSNPLRQPGTAAAPVVSVAVGLVGAGLVVSERWKIGLLLAAAGLSLELTVVALHDRRHRRRGEPPHAMWGLNDKNRPAWFPPRRS